MKYCNIYKSNITGVTFINYQKTTLPLHAFYTNTRGKDKLVISTPTTTFLVKRGVKASI